MRRTRAGSTVRSPAILTRDYEQAHVSLWNEVLFGAELLLLHAAPVYYGLGTPHGDGSGVVLIPGFLCPDQYLIPMQKWLERIGYQAFLSGIRFNAECPNLLIQQRLNVAIDKALAQTGRRIHLIGHSLGGIIARSIAAQRAADIASVITLASPFRGTVAHSSILFAAETVRRRILKKHGEGVLPDCYTGYCTCNFVDSLQRRLPASVFETAVFTRNDGVVDWHYCRTDNPEADFPVTGTHIGLAFNPTVYSVIANRLAQAQCEQKKKAPKGGRIRSGVKCATT